MSVFHFIDGLPLANVTFSVTPHMALPLFLSCHRLGEAAIGCPHSCPHCFQRMGAEFWPKVWPFPWRPACHLTLHRDPALSILLYSAGLHRPSLAFGLSSCLCTSFIKDRCHSGFLCNFQVHRLLTVSSYPKRTSNTFLSTYFYVPF